MYLYTIFYQSKKPDPKTETFWWVNRTISAPDYTDNDEYESLSALLDLIEKALINSRDFASRHTLHSSYN